MGIRFSRRIANSEVANGPPACHSPSRHSPPSRRRGLSERFEIRLKAARLLLHPELSEASAARFAWAIVEEARRMAGATSRSATDLKVTGVALTGAAHAGRRCR